MDFSPGPSERSVKMLEEAGNLFCTAALFTGGQITLMAPLQKA